MFAFVPYTRSYGCIVTVNMFFAKEAVRQDTKELLQVSFPASESLRLLPTQTGNSESNLAVEMQKYRLGTASLDMFYSESVPDPNNPQNSIQELKVCT